MRRATLGSARPSNLAYFIRLKLVRLTCYTPSVHRGSARLLCFVSLAVLAFGQGCRRKSAEIPVARIGHHKVTLTWRASDSPVLGYRIYRTTNPNDPPGLVGVTPADTTHFTDVTVQSGRTYFYVVKAFDSANRESAPSKEVSAEIPTP